MKDHKQMGTAGAKVTVASKLPFKLEMQCCSKRVVQQKHQGQAWREEVFFKSGPSHITNGIAYPSGTVPEGMPPPPQLATGFALTHDVDKDLFDAWMEENKDSAMVKNRLVFAFEKIDSVKDKAKNYRSLDSGLGPLTPDAGDRRMPKKLLGGAQARTSPESEPD
jgi:hypothetical protein